jgi:hypothetical protein
MTETFQPDVIAHLQDESMRKLVGEAVADQFIGRYEKACRRASLMLEGAKEVADKSGHLSMSDMQDFLRGAEAASVERHVIEQAVRALVPQPDSETDSETLLPGVRWMIWLTNLRVNLVDAAAQPEKNSVYLREMKDLIDYLQGAMPR